jgi:hypothetical protein
MFLFHMDCYRRTDIDAGLAFGAFFLVYLGNTGIHGDRLFRALVHARLTSDTEILVNNSRQSGSSLIRWEGKTIKDSVFPLFAGKIQGTGG